MEKSEIQLSQEKKLLIQQAFDFVDTHFNQMLSELATVCSFRSVAGDEKGLQTTRDYLMEQFRKEGLTVQSYPISGGNDLIYASCSGVSDETMLFYNHYDVVEEGAREAWGADPYKLDFRNDRMYARGISDNKGPIFTKLHAMRAIRAVMGGLPVNVKFITEGDEETFSPSLQKFAKENPLEFAQISKADLCIWENGWKDAEERPWLQLGCRGCLQFKLHVKSMAIDTHNRMGCMLPNAGWRLVWALASMKDTDENILIDGFYDDLMPETPEDIALLENFPYEEEGMKKRMQIDSFLKGLTGLALKKRIYLEPSLNIGQVDVGEMARGERGIIPHEAVARVGISLAAAQDPDDIWNKVRAHLDKHGFQDVEMIHLGQFTPTRTDIKTPYRDRIARAGTMVYKKPFIHELTQLGAGPGFVFRNAWPNMPIIGIGPANTGSNHHAPDENLSVEDYRESIKMMIALMLS